MPILSAPEPERREETSVPPYTTYPHTQADLRQQSGTSAIDDFRDNSVQFANGSKDGIAPSGSDFQPADSETFSWLRRKAGEIVDDERVQLAILILIATNSIMYGFATAPSIRANEEVMKTFEYIDMVILVIFTIESILQFIFNGIRRFFKDGWLVFDLIIVIVSWISLEVEELKAFRVFRAFRFVTRISMLRNIVVAIFSIIPAITAICTLLLLISYIFGVMFTQLFKDYHELGYTSANYFGRLDFTFFTLFQMLCLDDWAEIAYEVEQHAFWAWIIFITYIVISAFVVVNLLIAVICDALQILRTVETAMSNDDDGAENAEAALLGARVDGDGKNLDAHNLEVRVAEMQKMLDDMIQTQENMTKTIQILSLALQAEREPMDLLGNKTIQY